MVRKRNQHSPSFKSKVAIEAVKGMKTVSELTSDYGVHPTVIRRWKKQLLDGVSEIFKSPVKGNKVQKENDLNSRLYEEIGRLKVELDWLKKKADGIH